MRLYLVWDSEGISESSDKVLEEIFESVDADSDSEEVGNRGRSDKKDKKRGKKRSKSSGGSSAVSVASSSSEAGQVTVRNNLYQSHT